MGDMSIFRLQISQVQSNGNRYNDKLFSKKYLMKIFMASKMVNIFTTSL